MACSLSTVLLTAECLKSEQFARFISAFDEDFALNRSLHNPPWCYINEKHFSFKAIKRDDEFIATCVTSEHQFNSHLNFLYVNKAVRGEQLGSQLITDWYTKSSRVFFTIHVKKTLKRTQIFYQQHGFVIDSVLSTKVEPWVKQCLQFNPHTYEDAVLMVKPPSKP